MCKALQALTHRMSFATANIDVVQGSWNIYFPEVYTNNGDLS